jgi:hypothetical protein
LTPVRCGFLLTRSDLAALAATLDIPTGFGGRRLELMNLLRGAGRFESLNSLCDQLTSLVGSAAEHRSAYWPAHDALSGRLSATRRWLSEAADF